MDDLIKIGIGVAIGLFIAYFFLWGETYSDLNQKYDVLQKDYQKLNNSYVELQQNYTLLQSECSQVLQKYSDCVGREDFFTLVDRFFTLRNLAKLIGLI